MSPPSTASAARLGSDPGERLEFFRPAALPGTEMMAVYDSGRAWRMYHERYALCVCHKAAARARYRGREDMITDGAVVVREPGETHSNTYVGKPAEFKVMFVEPRLVAEAARELGGAGPPHFPALLNGHGPDLYPALDGLCSAIEARAEPLEQQSRFAAVVAGLLQHAGRAVVSGPKHGKRAVEGARTYLRERFSEAVSLQELSAVSGLSRFHLVHAFTREWGLAPHAFQIHVRIERARSLLREGMPAVEVAAHVGFSDQSQLTRHFKRITHVTPSEYARAIRKQ